MYTQIYKFTVHNFVACSKREEEEEHKRESARNEVHFTIREHVSSGDEVLNWGIRVYLKVLQRAFNLCACSCDCATVSLYITISIFCL